MKKILVIDNYDSFVYNIVQFLKETGICDTHISYNDQIAFDSLDIYDGILLSPGPGLPPDSGELIKLINNRKDKTPMLGVCLGHQALGQAFGAQMQHIEKPLHGHASALKNIDMRDILFKGIEEPVIVGRYHSWVLNEEEFPSELRISSLDEDGNIMSFYHERLPIHGVQFHPESYITNFGGKMIQNWVDSL